MAYLANAPAPVVPATPIVRELLGPLADFERNHPLPSPI
jgi:hypothetical protein